MTDLTFPLARSGETRYGMRHVVRAEWTKLRSLRSTWWIVLVTLVGSLLVDLLSTASAGHHARAWYQGFDPTNQALSGLMVAVLSIGVLGALAITGEHSTGTLRATLAAAPRRRVLVGAKVVVVGVTALCVGEVVAFACFGAGQLVLAHGGAPTASLTQGAVFRAVSLSGATLALLCLGGLGLGLLVRSTAGALALYAGLVFVLPVVLQRPVFGHAGRFTPMALMANSVAAVVHQPHVPGPFPAFGLMLLYCLVTVVVGAAALCRRDT
jgi:ABC-2 type transport system permease protein